MFKKFSLEGAPSSVQDGTEHISGGNLMKKHVHSGARTLLVAVAAIALAVIGFTGCEQPTADTPAADNPGTNNPGAGTGTKGLQLSVKDNLDSIKSGDSVQLTVTLDGTAVAASELMWKINDGANIIGLGSYVDANQVFHADKNETRDSLTIKAIHKSKNLSMEKTLVHSKYRDMFGEVFTLTNTCSFPDFEITDAERLSFNFSFDGSSIGGRREDVRIYTLPGLVIGDINDYFIEVMGKQFAGSWSFLYKDEIKIGIVLYTYYSSGYIGVTDKPCYQSTLYLGKDKMSYPLTTYANYSPEQATNAISDASTDYKGVLHGEIKAY